MHREGRLDERYQVEPRQRQANSFDVDPADLLGGGKAFWMADRPDLDLVARVD
jgi:hypothetical protein